MCGITGIFHFDREAPVDEAILTAMRETMVHRGPDGAGNWLGGHVGLGHRRLSIVDVAAGHQPMSNEDGSVWVTFNGEIYNHQELRSWLVSRGHTFRTHSDTEALVHLYEEEGEEGVKRLKGMFAFGLYDARRDRLLLVRDRLGVKPLYYLVTPQRVLFGSEIKAILAHPGVTSEVNWPRIPEFFLYGSIYGHDTFLRGVEELEPGHLLIADRRGVTIQQYWDLPRDNELEAPDREQHDHAKVLLQEAVRRRLMSDVPLGAFLSGGVDSSLIVALMTEFTGHGVLTFSIGFGEPGFNEFRYSRAVAEQYRTRHTEVVLDRSRFFDALPQLVWHYDEPIALSASVPLYFLAKETKGKATVMLSGEGADEVFLGYEKYLSARRHAARVAAFQRLVPSPLRPGAIQAARRAFGSERRLFDRLNRSPAEVAASFYHQLPPAHLDALFAPDGPVRREPGAIDGAVRYFDAAPTNRDFLGRMSYMDLKTFLVTLLMKQDKMTMAAGIEARVPFLDHELVEYGYRVPTRLKIQRGTQKKILKDIAMQYFSRDHLHRPKLGFPVPVETWFQVPAVQQRLSEILLDPSTLRRGIFRPDAVERQLRASAASGGQESSENYFIWNLINFELWMRRFVDGSHSSA